MLTISTVHCWFDPRRQPVYRLAHGVCEVVHSSLLRSAVKDLADLAAVQPELDVVLLVSQRVLAEGEP